MTASIQIDIFFRYMVVWKY